MTDFGKRVDPNATIQLDKVDALDLIELEAADKAEREAREARASVPVSRRTAPPPLPPLTSESPPRVSAAPPSVMAPSTGAPPKRGITAVRGLLFLLLLGGAIIGGLYAGRLIRGPSQPQASATAASPSPPAPAASASSHTLTLPAVEIGP